MKFDTILVRYGELGLKSKQVRRKFEGKLQNNINSFLKRGQIEAQVNKEWGRFFIETSSLKALDIMQRIFGIVSVSPVHTCNPTLSEIKKISIKIAEKHIKKSDTFAVRARRTGTQEFKSKDIDEQVGAEIVKKIKAKVNLSNPKKELFIEVRDKAYVFTEIIAGPGGLPYGIEGKVLAVYENKPNFGLAVWLMAKRGAEVEIICAKKDKEKAGKIAKKLSPWFLSLKIHACTENIYKAAEQIALQTNAKALVSSANLNALKNFEKISQSASLPVFRPLIGLDKETLTRYKKLF